MLHQDHQGRPSSPCRTLKQHPRPHDTRQRALNRTLRDPCTDERAPACTYTRDRPGQAASVTRTTDFARWKYLLSAQSSTVTMPAFIRALSSSLLVAERGSRVVLLERRVVQRPACIRIELSSCRRGRARHSSGDAAATSGRAARPVSCAPYPNPTVADTGRATAWSRRWSEALTECTVA